MYHTVLEVGTMVEMYIRMLPLSQKILLDSYGLEQGLINISCKELDNKQFSFPGPHSLYRSYSTVVVKKQS